LSKQKLLLSAAAMALLSGHAYATSCTSGTSPCTITSDSAVTTPIITGVLNNYSTVTFDDDYIHGVGSVSIASGGTLKINDKGTVAINVNSASYVYNGGTILNKGVSSAYGVQVEFLDGTDTYAGFDSGVYTGTATTTTAATGYTAAGMTFNRIYNYQVGSCTSACTFTNLGDDGIAGTSDDDVVAVYDLSSTGYAYTAADGTTRHAALYLDSGSVINLTGDGSAKYGLWVDASSAEDALGILVGDIYVAKGAAINMKGTTTTAIVDGTGALVVGNVTIAGSITADPDTATSTSASSIYGLYFVGGIDGDVAITDSATLTITGNGSQGMVFSGSGITGSLTIDGTVVVRGIDPADAANPGTKTYGEAGVGLSVGGSVGGGIMLGSSSTLTVTGTAEAMLISPSITRGSSTYATKVSQVIGVYDVSELSNFDHAGFGLYNRGTISIIPVNEDSSTAAALEISGGGSRYPSIIEGGIYNSGTISAKAFTSDITSSVSASAILIDGYVNIGGSYDYSSTTDNTDKYVYTADVATYTSSYADDSVTSQRRYSYNSSGYSYTGGGASLKTGGTLDQASFVNTGTISAAVYGLSEDTYSYSDGGGGGSAVAISISSYAHLASLINTGTISASVTVAADNIDTVTAASAYAIYDHSGSLTYIHNYGGTISATATDLDSETDVGVAIYSGGNSKTDAGSGMTIVNESTSSASAKIYGNVGFGDGDNQQIYLLGNSSYYAYLYGDISYGGSTYAGEANGDLLYIGSYSVAKGIVTAANGVAVQIENYGSLTLENDTESLNASNLFVAENGYLSIAVSKDMEDTGAINVLNRAVIDLNSSGSNLDVSYNSFIPQGTDSYLLIRAVRGSLVDSTNTSLVTLTDTGVSGGVLTAYNNAVNDAKPWLFDTLSLVVETTSDNAYDELILNVTPKTAEALHLTGYAADAKFFAAVNNSLSADTNLGSAMINYITDDSAAQKAYEAFAPNATGAIRAIAVSLTDQATGVIGDRQRTLRRNDREQGRMTLWMQGFVQNMKLPSQGMITAEADYADSSGNVVTTGTETRYAKPGFKDKGFGFALGADWGSPRFGWYGAALTFYNGDVQEIGRDSHQNQIWVLADLYSSWRGKGLFFDTKIGAGIGSIHGKRYLTLTNTDGDTYDREADSHHLSTMLSGGVTGGAVFEWGGLTATPQVSIDGLVLREEGYTESNPDNSSAGYRGFDLKVKPYYARSLRGFAGTSLRYDFELLGATWQPEVRGGYRYDLYKDAIKIKAAMRDISADVAGNQNSDLFELEGPSTPQGALVAGGSFGTTGDGWSLNFSYEMLRGTHEYREQVGTFNLLFRM
jgi:hypothetical protein